MNYNELNIYLYYYIQKINCEKNQISMQLIQDPKNLNKVYHIQIQNIQNVQAQLISPEEKNFYEMIMGFDCIGTNKYIITTEQRTISFTSIYSPIVSETLVTELTTFPFSQE